MRDSPAILGTAACLKAFGQTPSPNTRNPTGLHGEADWACEAPGEQPRLTTALVRLGSRRQDSNKSDRHAEHECPSRYLVQVLPPANTAGLDGNR